jgi:uncharacterized protein
MRWNVEAAGGEVPVLVDDEGPGIVAILAHGAGSHMEQKTMEWLAQIVRESGARVVRFNFLYRAQGRGMPDRMPLLIETYRAVMASVRATLNPSKLIIGGHSMGGRTASMLAAQETVSDGLLLFGYPLHPPGQPEKLRDAHLRSIKTPTLQFNGTADELCTRQIMDRLVSGLDPELWRLEWLAGADHSYGVKKSSGSSRTEVQERMVAVLSNWLAQRTPANVESLI